MNHKSNQLIINNVYRYYRNTWKVINIEKEGTNIHFTIQSEFTHELKIDQSVAHNGVCLTVVAINDDEYTVTAIQETLEKTSLRNLTLGSV